MVGVESVIGRAFVSAIMKAVVDTASSYFADKYKDHKDTQKMLESLERALPQILLVIELAERKPVVQEASLAAWLRQLKDVVYEAEDVMDDFEAIRIRKVCEIPTTSFLSDKAVENLKCLLNKIQDVSKGVGDLINVFLLRNVFASEVSSSSSIRETSSFLPKYKKIFGRDKEIELILDMIIGSPEIETDLSSHGLESSPDPKTEMEDKSDNIGDHNSPHGNVNIDLMDTASYLDDLLRVDEKTISPDQNAQECPVIRVDPIQSVHHNPLSPDTKPRAKRPCVAMPTSYHLPDLSTSLHPMHPFSSDKSSSWNYSDSNVTSPLIPKFINLNSSVGSDNIFASLRSSLWSLSTYVNISFSVGNRSLNVLPIVGIGGIGKTTIAQVIYNHPRVKEHFELLGWVYVVDSADHKRIVQDILCSFDAGMSKSMDPITSLNDGHLKLKHAIRGKKFLIVFDDVREGRAGLDSTWDKLLEVLAEGARGSIVIVTCEIKGVADAIGTLPPVSLDVLQWVDFLALFEHHSFGHIKYGNENKYCPLTHYEETVLKPIGEQIAKRLGGLPLAAEVVGNMLRIKSDKNHWENILESNWWDLQDVYEKIICSLGVSFQNLDPDLKQCFMYCSLFPKNYVFHRDRLVQMWIAHRFIHPTELEQARLNKKEIRIEDIGVSRFNKLLDRYFFQSTIWENRYVLHDLIRQLAIAISSDMLYLSGNYLTENKTIPPTVRHLAIDPDIEDDVSVDQVQWSGENIKSLRTILFFGFCKISKDEGINDTFDILTRLRLLDLSYFKTGQISLSDRNMGQLSHLRFLDLSFSGITELPNLLCQLVHLQVLDLRGCQFSKLPDKMNRLINLRHLYASPQTVSLIHGIGRLTNLQELEEFQVGEMEGFRISELTDMDLLGGQLTIRSLKNVSSKEEAINANVKNKKHLASLSFWYYEDPEYIPNWRSTELLQSPHNIKHMQILEGLKPHKNVRELRIAQFLWISFPSWMMEIHLMNNLRSVQLIDCLRLETLPPLGSLPSLEVLDLSNLDSIINVGEEFHGTSNVVFPALKELTIYNLWDWVHWLDPEERQQLFPCLQRLKITKCPNLSKAPLHHLKSSVVELHLSECSGVVRSVGIHFPAMTALTHLSLCADYFTVETKLCCDHLHELQVLTLGKVRVPHLEEQISSLVNLEKLIVSGNFRRNILNNKKKFTSGKQKLWDAQELHNMQSLPSLTSLEIHYCNGIPDFLMNVGRFPSLQTLSIDNYYKDEFEWEDDFWLQRLTSLEDLKLTNCRSLRCLPPSLSTLSSLKKFTLKKCPEIPSLPQKGLPQSLKELYISECSDELTYGCEPNRGTEWPKISHIPYIRIQTKRTSY